MSVDSPDTPEERMAAALERARIHRLEADEAYRLLGLAVTEVERDRLKRLGDRHAASVLHHERAAQFQASAIERAKQQAEASTGPLGARLAGVAPTPRS